jgi:hypothetical protein
MTTFDEPLRKWITRMILVLGFVGLASYEVIVLGELSGVVAGLLGAVVGFYFGEEQGARNGGAHGQ